MNREEQAKSQSYIKFLDNVASYINVPIDSVGSFTAQVSRLAYNAGWDNAMAYMVQHGKKRRTVQVDADDIERIIKVV